MEIENTVLVPMERTRDAKGRWIFSKAERERLLSEYDESGLTQAAFARREGVKYMTFVTWLQHRRLGRWPSSAASKPKPITFAKLSVKTENTQTGNLEAMLGDGTRLRAGSVEELAALVKAFRG